MMKTKASLGLFLSAISYLLFPVFAQAAGLYFSPASGTFGEGRNFTVDVMVQSSEQAMNTVDALITFPTDKLQVASVSKVGSIFNLWVQEPTFSNAGPTGNIRFVGVVLNPGYTGSAGRILRITFNARNLGTAPVTFQTGSVLANDGAGTDITSTLGTASFIIQNGKAAVPVITQYPKRLTSPGETLIVEGKGAVNSAIEVILRLDKVEKGKAEPITLSTATTKDGNWKVTYENVIPAGTYKLTARQTLNNGAESPETEPVFTQVGEGTGPVSRAEIDKRIDNLFLLLMLILIAIIIFGFYYYYFRLRVARLSLKKDVEEARLAVEQGLAHIRKSISRGDSRADVFSDIKSVEHRVEKEISEFWEKFKILRIRLDKESEEAKAAVEEGLDKIREELKLGKSRQHITKEIRAVEKRVEKEIDDIERKTK